MNALNVQAIKVPTARVASSQVRTETEESIR